MPHINVYIPAEDMPLVEKLRDECYKKKTSISKLVVLWMRRHEEETREAEDGKS